MNWEEKHRYITKKAGYVPRISAEEESKLDELKFDEL